MGTAGQGDHGEWPQAGQASAKEASGEEAKLAEGHDQARNAGGCPQDDLKVVNGIGPKMEGILNSFGIQTWEQLGAFKKADVEKVTEAINTFPGRIERDEWVAQAKDLVKRFPLTKPYNRPTRETYLNEV